MDYSYFEQNYHKVISLYREKPECIPDFRIFEILWALENKRILWDDIPPNFQEMYNLPHMMDYGVDLISLDYRVASQVKNYGTKFPIDFRKISTFFTYAKGMLGINNLELLTTPVARISPTVEYLLKDYVIQRKSFRDMLSKVPKIKGSTTIEPDVNSIEQRDYLVECSELFRDSPELSLRFQLPCGMGKTYIIYDIILKSEGKYIVFVPWIDLLHQFQRNAVKLGIRCGVIGDGEEDYEENDDVIVCTYGSVENVPKWNFKYKFLDEAHHLENELSVYNQKIGEVKCEKELRLSATYRDPEDMDYSMNMRDGIDKGYLSDYVFHIEYFTTDNKTNALLEMIKKNVEWAPIFIYFNSTEKAINFSKLVNDAGISATYLTGKCGKIKRRKVVRLVKDYRLPVLCLCGVFNEGISINELQTVVFGDLRFSDINKIQVAMRASRKCSTKPFFRIVLPVMENEMKEKDIESFMKTFFTIDPKIKESLENRSISRIKVRQNHMKFGEHDNVEAAELVREEIYDSLGNMLKGMTMEEKCKELIEWVEENAKVPSRTGIYFSDNKNMGNFWYMVKSKKYINSSQFSSLYECNFLKDDYDKYQEYCETKKEKLSINDKIEEFLDYVKLNKKVPLSTDKETLFSNGSSMAKFWTKIKANKKLDNPEYSKLSTEKIIKDNYQKSVENSGDDGTRLKINQVIEWTNKKGKVPSNKDPKALFANGEHLGQYWMTVKKYEKCSLPVYSELLTNAILDADYKKYLSKKQKKISDSEKVDEFLEFMKKHNKIPPHYDSESCFSSGELIGSFWKRIKLAKIVDEEPFKKLLTNATLKSNYEAYLQTVDKNPMELKVDALLKYVEEHKEIPTQSNKEIVFYDGKPMGLFWRVIKDKKKIENEPYSKLMSNAILKENYEKKNGKVIDA